MLTSDFYFELPENLIAQVPPEKRGTSRMLVLHKNTGIIEHKAIKNITDYIRAGDVMVFNDTKVFPARTFGHWEDSSGKIEVLFIEPSLKYVGAWTIICRTSRPIKSGMVMLLANDLIKCTVLEKSPDGYVDIKTEFEGDFFGILEQYGMPPVPPYIHRDSISDNNVNIDRIRYQTVYARITGSVAAPTAGLHFSNELLSQIDDIGALRKFVTLHVGPGTFRPVKTTNVEDHKMDEERFEIAKDTVDAIAAAKSNNHRVIAVGSTSVRTLETCANDDGTVYAGFGRSSAFIYPPYKFKTVDVMLTNFHLPCSTLLMMICALAGKENVFKAYNEAIREKYMFYSYGDCMLII